jgi:hypothetical protein
MSGKEFRLELDTDVTTAAGDCASAFVVASWWRAQPLRSTVVGRINSVLLDYGEAREISATAKLSTPGKSSAYRSTMTRFNRCAGVSSERWGQLP